MPYQREKFSSWWVIVWTILFFGGMVLIFSFLLGNPFFSGKITGKYIFSAAEKDISLFMDGEFLEMGASEGNIILGKKEFCAEQYFFQTRCFEEEVRSNGFSIVEQSGVTLFPRELRVDNITEEKVYFDPSLGGLFWVDFEKNVVWGIKKEESLFFSQRIPSAFTSENIQVKYDNGEKHFVLSQKKISPEEEGVDTVLEEKMNVDALVKNTEIPEVTILFPENFIDFSEVKNSFSWKDEKLEFQKSSIVQKEKDSDVLTLLASFSEPALKMYSYNTNKIFEFSSSVWMFTPEKNSFQKLLDKDEHTRVFWHENTVSLFFQYEGGLKRVYLR